MKREFKEGDWAAYNWRFDDGSDNWKVGRILNTDNGLMFFSADLTKRSGFVPITSGVILLTNEV